MAWAARSLLVFAAGVVAAWLATENRSAACTHPPEPHPRTGPRPRLVVTQLHWCFYLAVVLQLAACTADSPTRRRAVLSGLAVEAVVTAIVFWTGLTDLNHCLDAP
ncbi:MAG: hypothetical protein ACXVXG_15030 [Nocardioidaceae bacterium]